LTLAARLARSRWTGIALAALICGLYARGGAAWVLGFVALVPWLRTLDAETRWTRTLLSAWVMSVAYTATVFYWFGSALGAYTQIGAGAGLALLLVAAPLFQPQILVFALVRHLVRHRHGAALAAFASAAAWVAAEWALPHVLGDTFGHGLYPSPLLRQAAELGGATGLTVVLLLANEALTAALARRREGLRALAPPLALAAVGPLLLAGYGFFALQPEPPATTKPLRMGLVQSNITDYERLKRERGAEAVVREVLDTHFAMSYDAVERQRVDAVLWSETVYPTSFGQPKSEAGAELDAEIQAIINAAGVPFVFGTYDRDAAGEYNAAAFVQPRSGLAGMYRKTRLFPFTEYLPSWLDTPTVRGWLPGAGNWRPGSGARILPLRLADRDGEGREVPVLPLICLDDTDAGLAIAGARLGAQVILTMSNDSWFTDYEQGAALHQAVAAFRSIETRLPQFRVTTNGFSAVIDARGHVIAATRMGERTLVIGDLPVRDPAPTLMVRWGDWVGQTAAGFLAVLVVWSALRRWVGAVPLNTPAELPARLIVLPAAARAVAGLLRLISRGGALAMGAAVLWGDGALQTNTLALLRMFTALCLIPEAAAWALLRTCTATVTRADGLLVLTRGAQRLAIPLHDIAAIEPWRLPLPGTGASLRLTSGERWPYGLALPDPWALALALGVPVHEQPLSRAWWAYARSRTQQAPNRLDHPAFKFLLLPFLLAVPAFQLHQKIAYGSAFGEFYSFGLGAYLTAFALWWAAWIAGVVLCAAAVRAMVELAAFVGALARPQHAMALRAWLERLGLAALYLGLPAWLLLRAVAS
jgi:apolipoprotein N-acyltransferase